MQETQGLGVSSIFIHLLSEKKMVDDFVKPLIDVGPEVREIKE